MIDIVHRLPQYKLQTLTITKIVQQDGFSKQSRQMFCADYERITQGSAADVGSCGDSHCQAVSDCSSGGRIQLRMIVIVRSHKDDLKKWLIKQPPAFDDSVFNLSSLSSGGTWNELITQLAYILSDRDNENMIQPFSIHRLNNSPRRPHLLFRFKFGNYNITCDSAMSLPVIYVVHIYAAFYIF